MSAMFQWEHNNIRYTQNQACSRLRGLQRWWRSHHIQFPRFRYEEFPDVLRQNSDLPQVSLQKKRTDVEIVSGHVKFISFRES